MDRYAVLSTLGSGTFGEVFKARHRRTGDVVAIKRLRLRCPSFADALGLAEVASLRRLSAGQLHPGIVQIFEVIRESSGALQLVFEYMADGNLYDLIRRAAGNNGRDRQLLSHPRIRSITSQVLSGLAFMNSRSYFHRDLKPENILISGPVAKIADMGLAKSTHGAAPLSSYVATRWYRGPELLLRSPRYTKTVDSFAVGCIVAELYNLAPLFPGSNELDQLWKIWSVTGVPTEDTWPEGVALAKRLGISSLPTIVPYERRREYKLEQRRLQQQWEAAAQQRQWQQQQEAGGEGAAAAAAAAAEAAAAVPHPMMTNAILHIPLERTMRTAPESAQRLIAALLVMDPAKRPDAAEALRHDYFASPISSPILHDRRPSQSPRRAKEDGIGRGINIKKRGRMVDGDHQQPPVATSEGRARVGDGGVARENYFAPPPLETTVANKQRKALSSCGVERRQNQHGDQRVYYEQGRDDNRPSYAQKKRRQQVASASTQFAHVHQPQLKDVSTNSNNITPVEASNNAIHPSKGGGFHEWLLAGVQQKEGSETCNRREYMK